MSTRKTVALIGLGYIGMKLYERYRQRRAIAQYVKTIEERQQFVEEQLDKMHRHGKRVRFLEFQRQLDDFVDEHGFNPYLREN